MGDAGTRIGDALASRLRRPAARPPLVAMPMANSREIIHCIRDAIDVGLAQFVLIGPADEARRLASEHGVDLSATTFVDQTDAATACRVAADMAAAGTVQVLMKGHVQTSDFVRSILGRKRGLAPAGRLLSHVALCDVPGYDRIFLLTDAGITTYPGAAQKRLIVLNALACATAVGLERPRVAMVAPVEKVSEKVPSTGEAAAVVEGFAGDDRLEIDGPFGLDVAISRDAARTKGIGGEVAGRADILVMPNIDAANVLYKSLTGFARARTAGIIAGAAVPIVLTSRSDSEESRLNSLRFALIAARGRTEHVPRVGGPEQSAIV